MLTDFRTGAAILLVTSFNALAYNVVHNKMIAVSGEGPLACSAALRRMETAWRWSKVAESAPVVSAPTADDVCSHDDSHRRGQNRRLAAAFRPSTRCGCLRQAAAEIRP